jgi:hypothetical protein
MGAQRGMTGLEWTNEEEVQATLPECVMVRAAMHTHTYICCSFDLYLARCRAT